MATLKTGCKNAIYAFADAEMQANASLFGEETEFVTLVIKLYRDHYRELVAQGATEWQESQTIEDYLNSIKPY